MDHELEVEAYDVETPVTTILANAANRQSTRMSRPSGNGPDPAVRLPNDIFSQLGPDGRRAWSQMPEQARQAIVRACAVPGIAPLHTPSQQAHQLTLVPYQAFQHAMVPFSGSPPPVYPPTFDRMGSLHANQHQIAAPPYPGMHGHVGTPPTPGQPPDYSQFLINAAMTGQPPTASTPSATSSSTAPNPPPGDLNSVHPGNVARMLGDSSTRQNDGNRSANVHWADAQSSHGPRQANMHYRVNVAYRVSRAQTANAMSLVDRGANGGIAGDDMRRIDDTHRVVNIYGIDDHKVEHVPIVTAGGLVETQLGPVIAIFHQYAYFGRGHSIHSPVQLEHFGNRVDGRPRPLGGRQVIFTVEGYVMPVNIVHGLPRLRIRPYTDTEWDDPNSHTSCRHDRRFYDMGSRHLRLCIGRRPELV